MLDTVSLGYHFRSCHESSLAHPCALDTLLMQIEVFLKLRVTKVNPDQLVSEPVDEATKKLESTKSAPTPVVATH